MPYTILYYDEAVRQEIFMLPETLRARYIALTARMKISGANLGAAHAGIAWRLV